ncbi:MAG: DUF1080 domain-containing protein [Verrucomicrobia bacterium]|nr:MAG: DUF1080 domain-containing protein [Verrucomicrobiota bacterium]TAE86671.1 MAG: DUF1080 domain-containing protein [Verrucomicrobiota bacterium]TAF24451.1 MAG: DUF1080 domain-containing protein [Verrucomicrobiota bacterium]TAF40012.1 MAG: DUF1080 domain-containing protein [Verrucomicrobiota bacterium]
MRSFFLLIALSLSVSADPNAVSPEELEDGFKPLFDGKTLAGWRTYKAREPKPQWQVVDASITLTTGGGGDLITEKQFADFELRWEWKIAAEGNSGVMWRVAETDQAASRTGPEYQLLDPAAQGRFLAEVAKGNVGGALYDLDPADPGLSKPAGQWNSSRLRVRGSRMELFLRGILTADVDLESEEWARKIAASKFATWPRFAKEPKGHICLQDHGNPVSFRHLRIKEL